MSHDTVQRLVGIAQLASGVAGIAYGGGYGAGSGAGNMAGMGVANIQGKDTEDWWHRKGGFGQDAMNGIGYGVGRYNKNYDPNTPQNQYGSYGETIGGMLGGLSGAMGSGGGAAGAEGGGGESFTGTNSTLFPNNQPYDLGGNKDLAVWVNSSNPQGSWAEGSAGGAGGGAGGLSSLLGGLGGGGQGGGGGMMGGLGGLLGGGGSGGKGGSGGGGGGMGSFMSSPMFGQVMSMLLQQSQQGQAPQQPISTPQTPAPPMAPPYEVSGGARPYQQGQMPTNVIPQTQLPQTGNSMAQAQTDPRLQELIRALMQQNGSVLG